MFRVISMICLLATLGLAQEDPGRAVDSTHARDPGKALLYSFVPGGGQLYNKRPLKALLFSGVFVYFGVEYVLAQNEYQSDLSSADLHRKRNDKIWLMALTWTLNIIDAYVDAQLWDFEKYPLDEMSIPEHEILKPGKKKAADESN